MVEFAVSWERQGTVISEPSADGAAERSSVDDTARDRDIVYQQQHLGTTGIAGGQTPREILADIADQLRSLGHWFRRMLLRSHRGHA